LVGGDVEQSLTLSVDELNTLPRVEQCSDFHCVTTWSTADLQWSGYRFSDFLAWITPKVVPAEGVSWVGLVGQDGYRASLPIESADRADVILADSLGGQPLPLANGAPLRLVAPAHYGYKNVKHLVEISFHTTRPKGSAGRKEHPIALVQKEQRVTFMPGWLFRWLMRPVVGLLIRYYERHTPKEGS